MSKRSRYVQSRAQNPECAALAAWNTRDASKKEIALIEKSFGAPPTSTSSGGDQTSNIRAWTFDDNAPFAMAQTNQSTGSIELAILFPVVSKQEQRRLGTILRIGGSYRFDRALQRLHVTCNAGYANVGMLALAAAIMSGAKDAELDALNASAEERTRALRPFLNRARAAEFDADVYEYVNANRDRWSQEYGDSAKRAARVSQFTMETDLI